MDKKDNLTLGYFASLPLRDYVMSASYVYHVSKMKWMIPSGEEFSAGEKLLLPFQIEVWISCFVIFSVAFLVIVILKFLPQDTQEFVFGKRVTDPLLNVINVGLGGSLPQVPTRNFARTILFFFMIFCFIIQNSYKGRLFYYMKNSIKHPEYETTKELLNNNFTFYVLGSSKDFLVGMRRVYSQVIVVTNASQFGALTDKTMDTSSKIALFTSEDHLAWRNIIASPHKFYHHARETIFRSNIVIYMHKQSCLVEEINKIILNLLSGGLIRQFASNFINPSFLRREYDSTTKSLNLEQLNGAFDILAVGLSVSCVVFTIEVTFTRSNRFFHYFLSTISSRRK
jgi:hypothetical protein